MIKSILIFFIICLILISGCVTPKETIRSEFGFTIKPPEGWNVRIFPDDSRDLGDVVFYYRYKDELEILDELRIICSLTSDKDLKLTWGNIVSNGKLNISAIHDEIITPSKVFDENYEVIYEDHTKIENFENYQNYETINTESNKRLGKPENSYKIKVRSIYIIRNEKICSFYFQTRPDRFDSVNPLIEESLNSFKFFK